MNTNANGKVIYDTLASRQQWQWLWLAYALAYCTSHFGKYAYRAPGIKLKDAQGSNLKETAISSFCWKSRWRQVGHHEHVWPFSQAKETLPISKKWQESPDRRHTEQIPNKRLPCVSKCIFIVPMESHMLLQNSRGIIPRYKGNGGRRLGRRENTESCWAD